MSYRDVDRLLCEPGGIRVDDVTIDRWVQRFTAAHRGGPSQPGDRWFVDEIYVRVSGRYTYLYRPD